MRHGWNVYPLEAFAFLLGTANPPCVHAALPTSKTAHWDSHADRWNRLVEKRTVADEVAARFGLQVVGVYGTHEKGVDLQPFPAAFAAGIVITYSKALFQVAGYSGCYILADDLNLGEERVFRLDRIDWQP